LQFRIADTFTDSLSRLTGEEQKAVKTTAFDLQMNPANPGMQFHRVNRARDRRFWSVRASDDIRLIVHKTESSFLLCYAGHHDQAYGWAERRKLETHPRTGAAQLVEIREMVRKITVPQYVTPGEKPILFANVTDDTLLSYGVPVEWLQEVREADEDTVLELAEHLPAEAAEALLNLAIGADPEIVSPVPAGIDPFEHPDARRRFRVLANEEEFQRVLEYPWDKWAIFLHPAQRQLVEGDYSGPVRISGSAGTGKTIVALHRAVYLARNNPESRILLTTFSDTLARALKYKMKSLISNEPRIAERLEVYSLDTVGHRLYESNFGHANIANRKLIEGIVLEALQKYRGQNLSLRFLVTEWEEIVDAWQLKNWPSYRDVLRLGRKRRLPERQRADLWQIFEHIRNRLGEHNQVTHAGMFSELAARYEESDRLPFDYVVVDEAQDVSVAQLRFLAAIGGGRPDSLFFTGDLGQRIFQLPFSWKALGVDIRGRSRTLRINYRTSHQIRMHADRLLDPQLSDVDGNAELRDNTISVFNGCAPLIMITDNENDEIDTVGCWIEDRVKEGVKPHEIGVFVRSPAELKRACDAVQKANLPYRVLDENIETAAGYLSVSTMHLAKGLEFRAVAVVACDDEVIPLQARMEAVGDAADLEEVYNTERHLLYVACTRARDHLLITGVEPASEFIDDMDYGNHGKGA
jgi:mRNA-degrading endonuclease RelE of RelBE toxin-antitoxin system